MIMDAIKEEIKNTFEYKCGYKDGKENADKFYKQWHDDVVNDLCGYDANTIEEVYEKGRQDEREKKNE